MKGNQGELHGWERLRLILARRWGCVVPYDTLLGFVQEAHVCAETRVADIRSLRQMAYRCNRDMPPDVRLWAIPNVGMLFGLASFSKRPAPKQPRIRHPRVRTVACKACGVQFSFTTGGRPPWKYCPAHRGSIWRNRARREAA